MDLSYRRIDASDANVLGHLLEIEKQAFGDTALSLYEVVPILRNGRVYAAYDETRICAAVYFLRNFDDPARAYLMSVGVKQKYRGTGIGPALIEFALDDIKKTGVKSVALMVDPANYQALSVYREKLGFNAVENRESEYGMGEDRLVMRREL